MNFKNSFGLCALALFASTAAQAAQLNLEYKGTQGTEITMVNGGTPVLDYLSGRMQYTDAAGKSFEAFCVEVAQRHSLTGVIASYTVGSFSNPQAGLLQGLFSSSYANLSGDRERAAFQTAIWEITHETSGTLAAGDGSFRFGYLNLTSTAAEDQAFLGQVNDFLAKAVDYQVQSKPALYEITKLQSAEFQDLITVTAVPEPGTYAMLLAGLGVVGFVARRRQQR